MARLGMGVVGQSRHPFELDEMLWANTWKNGKRPVCTDTRSAEEIERTRQANAEDARIASAMIGDTIGAVERALNVEDAERAFINGVSATFAKKSATQRRIMSSQAGWSEKDVFGFWDPRSQIVDMDDGARMFVYHKEIDERVTTSTLDIRSGQVVASSTDGKIRQCELSLVL